MHDNFDLLSDTAAAVTVPVILRFCFICFFLYYFEWGIKPSVSRFGIIGRRGFVWLFVAGAGFCRTCFTEHHSSRSHQLHAQLPPGLCLIILNKCIGM